MAGDFPIPQHREGAPPTIVFLGSEDKLIPVRTAQAYEAKMKKVGAICKHTSTKVNPTDSLTKVAQRSELLQHDGAFNGQVPR